MPHAPVLHEPACREPLTLAGLFYNRALKEEIEEWRFQHEGIARLPSLNVMKKEGGGRGSQGVAAGGCHGSEGEGHRVAVCVQRFDGRGWLQAGPGVICFCTHRRATTARQALCCVGNADPPEPPPPPPLLNVQST